MSSTSAHDSLDAHGAQSPAPRILVIEDSATNLAATQMMLQIEHFDSIPARNIDDGWVELERNSISLVITDLSIDALRLIKKMRANSAYANIPILLATAERRENVLREALAAGATDTLIKPFMHDELLRAVMKCLDGRMA